jgi:hypothetical protein
MILQRDILLLTSLTPLFPAPHNNVATDLEEKEQGYLNYLTTYYSGVKYNCQLLEELMSVCRLIHRMFAALPSCAGRANEAISSGKNVTLIFAIEFEQRRIIC